MDCWLYIAIGAVIAGPVWIALAVWVARRMLTHARKLSRRTKGRERFIELGQLVGGLAHEIKNPLSTINVNLKLLSEDIARHDDEDHRRLGRRLETVQIEADRVKDILEDFLRFAGKYELALASTDLRRVVEELLDFFAPQADATGVVLRHALSESEVRCKVDADLIKQALLNLMINAVQAMPGGGELLVRLTTQRASAVIEVTDTGPGIPNQDLHKVFEVYFSSKKQGSGLGLPTSRRIVREHSGTLQVDSEIGKGTRFTITLPLEKQ